ncbi:hypothetical protein Tco_0420793 [Tanacetum coccineum]
MEVFIGGLPKSIEGNATASKPQTMEEANTITQRLMEQLIQKLRQKGVYEESFSRHAAWIGGKLIQLMHTTMVPVQVKTLKIQAGVQVSRPGELRRHLQLWKTLFVLYLYLIGTL